MPDIEVQISKARTSDLVEKEFFTKEKNMLVSMMGKLGTASHLIRTVACTGSCSWTENAPCFHLFFSTLISRSRFLFPLIVGWRKTTRNSYLWRERLKTFT